MSLSDDADVSEELLRHRQGVKERVLWHWSFEIVTLLFATSLFTAIAFVLFHYNGSFISDWPLPINLNTVVAMLSTIFRACLVIVLAEILSQSKWTWFRSGPRPLSDLQVYDEASRGLFGSVKLLGLLHGGYKGNILASGAAVVTILSLAVGPFTQQAITAKDCIREIPGSVDEDATVLVSNVIAGFGGAHGLKMRDNATLFNCSSQECHFGKTELSFYSIIGVCSECVDSAALATYNRDTRHVYIGNSSVNLDDANFLGPDLNVNSSAVRLVENITSAEFLARVKHSWSSATFIVRGRGGILPYIPDDPDPDDPLYPYREGDFMAATCLLYPCVKLLEGRVEKGDLVENIKSTEPILQSGANRELPGGYGEKDFGLAVRPQCVVNGHTYSSSDPSFYTDVLKNDSSIYNMTSYDFIDLEPRNCFYGVWPDTGEALEVHLNQTFFNATGVRYEEGGGDPNCGSAWWMESILDITGREQDGSVFDNIQRKHHNVAVAMTNYFRKTGADIEGYFQFTMKEVAYEDPWQVTGVAQQQTACMELEWPWLILPATLYLLSVALLAGVIVKNRGDSRQASWKSSILPLLFYGLQRDRQKAMKAADTTPTEDPWLYEPAAESLLVHLRTGMDGEHSRFVQVLSLDMMDQRAQKGTAYTERPDQGTLNEEAFAYKGDELSMSASSTSEEQWDASTVDDDLLGQSRGSRFGSPYEP